jgi:hypothetical protein
LTDEGFRRNWARLIRKIYEIDTLVCLQCDGQMRVIAFIEEMDVIRKIFKHLDIWDDKRKPLLTANSATLAKLQYTVEDAIPSAEDMTVDPIYPVEAYFRKYRRAGQCWLML